LARVPKGSRSADKKEKKEKKSESS
jgi:hypothetical protein